MSASFRTISFTFEAVRGEYLSRTQRATQRPAILSMQQKEIYGKPYVRRIYIYMWQAHLETASYAGSRNSRRKSLKMAVRFPFVTRKQSYVSY